MRTVATGNRLGRIKVGSSENESSRKLMERETGIEPVASSLGSWRSTAELLPLEDTLILAAVAKPATSGSSEEGKAPSA